MRLSNATVQTLQRREKARELARTNPSAAAALTELERSQNVEDPADEGTRVLRHCDQYEVNGSEVEIKMKLEPSEDAPVQIPAVDCTMPELEDWRFEFGRSYHDQEEEPTSPGFGRLDSDADSGDDLAPMLSYERYPFADFSGFCQALGKNLSSPESSQSCFANDEIASQSSSGRGEELERMFSTKALEGALYGSTSPDDAERLWQWVEELNFDEGECETTDEASELSCSGFKFDEEVKQMFSAEAWEGML
ncbi:hypothetical protein LTS18_000252 [Coniosporium uncinatum]|uniref:Uncharacterized protein n=1 Tax=Coniosporium uncinatum TaxID=93489 RepID=A0ACC3D887_9PEZI|nr:hypothetical protein LTS18_000252 [Coniosporium uncinatum]